jgi:hypothetical protein
VEIEWDPEEKSSFWTYNPSLLIWARRGWGFRIMEKGGGGMKSMRQVG